MAARVEAKAPPQVRPRRDREQEVLVWPDLVFIEFISAVVFTITRPRTLPTSGLIKRRVTYEQYV